MSEKIKKTLRGECIKITEQEFYMHQKVKRIMSKQSPNWEDVNLLKKIAVDLEMINSTTPNYSASP